jgi:predicted small metal-binding protein
MRQGYRQQYNFLYLMLLFGGASMKTMTCKELGGKCDQKLTANSWDEMVKVMTKHVMDKHPDVAKQMEKMHNDDPKKWAKEMKPKWEAAPDTSGH